MPGNANNFRSGSWYAIAITFGIILAIRMMHIWSG